MTTYPARFVWGAYLLTHVRVGKKNLEGSPKVLLSNLVTREKMYEFRERTLENFLIEIAVSMEISHYIRPSSAYNWSAKNKSRIVNVVCHSWRSVGVHGKTSWNVDKFIKSRRACAENVDVIFRLQAGVYWPVSGLYEMKERTKSVCVVLFTRILAGHSFGTDCPCGLTSWKNAIVESHLYWRPIPK